MRQGDLVEYGGEIGVIRGFIQGRVPVFFFGIGTRILDREQVTVCSELPTYPPKEYVNHFERLAMAVFSECCHDLKRCEEVLASPGATSRRALADIIGHATSALDFLTSEIHDIKCLRDHWLAVGGYHSKRFDVAETIAAAYPLTYNRLRGE